MTPHLHAEHVDGCYRCNLSRDEERPTEQEARAAVDELLQEDDAAHVLSVWGRSRLDVIAAHFRLENSAQP